VWHNPSGNRVPNDRVEGLSASWERACVARARRGECAAFAELYRAFAPRLYAQVLYPKLGDRAAAEDALSETFRALMEHLHGLSREDAPLWPWLHRVATNKALDVHRQRTRGRRALSSFEALLVPLADAADAGHELERQAGHRELRGRVGRVLAELPPRYARAIELRFLEDRPRDACAALMDVKLGTFDVLLLRALRAFRAQWEAQYACAERG
jgi:RNA polymerase sigma factor (sigma-70 family)